MIEKLENGYLAEGFGEIVIVETRLVDDLDGDLKSVVKDLLWLTRRLTMMSMLYVLCGEKLFIEFRTSRACEIELNEWHIQSSEKKVYSLN